MEEWQAFLKRMTEKREELIKKNKTWIALRPFISFEKLLDIFNFVLNEKSEELTEISQISPDSARRLKKGKTGLARTMTFLRTPWGKFKLILHINSKLANDQKYKGILNQGSFKKCKPASRLDKGPHPYVKLSWIMEPGPPDFPPDAATQQLEKELNVSAHWGGVFIAKNRRGPVIGDIKKDKGKEIQIIKALIYSRQAAHNNLAVFLKSGWKLTEEQKNLFIFQLLKSIEVIHADNCVHQDLKPENLLVFEKITGKLAIKLTDFGTVVILQSPYPLAISTVGYQSPELTYAHSFSGSELYAYFTGQKNFQPFINSLGYAYRKDYQGHDTSQLKCAHQKNDMWAAGVVSFEIKFGRKPTPQDINIIQADPLLAGLLHPAREERFDIKKALSIHWEIAVENPSRKKLARPALSRS